MLIQPTLDTLNRLKLHGMALGLSEQMTHNAAQGLSFEERLALLLDREALHRENNRMTRLLQLAQLKYRDAVIEDIDYRSRGGRSFAAGEPRLLRLGPRQSKPVDPRRNRFRQDVSGVRHRASGLPPGLERAVRAGTAAVRGVQPLPRRRQLPQAARRHGQNQRADHRRFCHRADRAAGAKRSTRVNR